MKVHINELKKGRKKGFKVRWHEDGKPKEAFRKEFKDALALQAQIRERFFGDSKEQYHKTHLTESQLNDAEAALLELNGRLSLREAARLALKHWIDAADGIPIEEARWRFLEQLESENLRPDTITKYKQTATRLAGHFEGRTTTDLSFKAVKDFMWQFKDPANFNGRRREMNRFLNYIVGQGWLPSNPLKGIKSKRIDPKQPEVLSPEEVVELFRVAKQHLPEGAIPYLAISVFAAIRPLEMKRLASDARIQKLINLDTGLVTLPADITKGRRVRNIRIRPALKAFLEAYPVKPALSDTQFKKLKRHLGFRIPHDGLRHTGITAIYMEHKNFGDTALETGNSEQIIRDHYLGFWTDAQAEKFWSLIPNCFL
jgi:site-specific recombinase XerC